MVKIFFAKFGCTKLWELFFITFDFPSASLSFIFDHMSQIISFIPPAQNYENLNYCRGRRVHRITVVEIIRLCVFRVSIVFAFNNNYYTCSRLMLEIYVYVYAHYGTVGSDSSVAILAKRQNLSLHYEITYNTHTCTQMHRKLLFDSIVLAACTKYHFRLSLCSNGKYWIT